jgi:MFS family permease
VLGGVLTHLVLGNYYIWGNVTEYVQSYFYHLGDHSANPQSASFMLPYAAVVRSLTYPIGAALQKRIHPKIILTMGISLIALGTFLETQASNFTHFTFYFCVLYNGGIGLCYYTPLICSWEWFPEKRGLVTGIILCCIGFGSFIFSFITTALVNPHNRVKEVYIEGRATPLYYDKEVSDRVPMMYITCLVIWVAMAVAGMLLISRNPSQVQKEKMESIHRSSSVYESVLGNINQSEMKATQEGPYDQQSVTTDGNPSTMLVVTSSVIVKPEITATVAVKNLRFWRMMSIMYLSYFLVSFIFSVYKTLALFDNDRVLTLAGSVGSMLSGISRIGWGSI